ncbi:hypothetical protein TCAL_14474 [Tigriopus californicus]|uniref:Uncharacterized protein n=1 Tax=Tigriopus californicus TaxID=6832 RepID=A0A553PTS3_TIGCA|nr:hypothetical protein TCAL_14474 [Tigriopus californicus]
MFQGLSEVRIRLDAMEENIENQGARLSTLEKAPKYDNQEMITELRLREEKRWNVIVKGIPEVNDKNPENRNKFDLDRVKTFMAALDISLGQPDIHFLYRMGKRESDLNKERPRMIILGLTDQKLRERILRNAHLARKTSEFKQAYVDPDLTKAQIQDDNEMRKEAAKRSESGNDIWKVKGLRGARRLVKLRK